MTDVEEGLDRAERMLKASYAGLNQFQKSEGEEKIIGLMNSVSNGRNVTFALQKNLKGEAEGFEEWYQERQAVLKEDPVCSRMNEVRTNIVHEGDESVSNYASISGNSSEIYRVMPPWADGAFIGDQYGGSGFYIEKDGGEQAKFYYDFSDANMHIETGLFFKDQSGSEDIPYSEITDAEEDLKYYVKILAELVQDAKDEFGD
ncbi:hypothetical protein [Natrinema versiforme]|nr:hypothetical protein [Natrinema versiforme]